MDDFSLYWKQNSIKVQNVNWTLVDECIKWLAENGPALKLATEALHKNLHKPPEDATI